MKSKKENKLIDPQKGEGYCLMYPFEKAFKNYLVPKISPYTETYYLTYLTLLWSALIIISGLLANKNSLWLLAFSVLIILQYFTDMLDGAVGRYKDTGLVKWGYYADHFLDYIFACSIIFGYHLYLQGSANYNPLYILIIGFLTIAFIVNSYLFSGVAKKFIISSGKIGPSEARMLVVLFNISLILFGNSWIIFILPYIAIAEALALITVTIRLQKELWQIDMKLKEELKKQKFANKNVNQLWG